MAIADSRRNIRFIPSLIALSYPLILFALSAAAQEGPFVALVSADGSTKYYSQRLRPQLLPLTTAPLGAVDACDLNADGKVDATDVQLAVNQALNLTPCTDADLHLNNTCTVLDVQVIAADIQTGICLVPNCVSPLTYPSTLDYPSTAPACPPPLPPNPNPPSTSQDDGPIHPCMYIRDGVRFQAILITGVSGELPLNLNLYQGTTCNPNNFVDEAFLGQSFPFFGTSIYWINHFWDQPNTSGVWTLGNITTPCIDYSKVADCN